MESDIAAFLGPVDRAMRSFTKEGKPASAVTLTRLYNTRVEDLCDALTSKARIPRWFAAIEGELKLGGAYQIKGNAGGTITACTPPTHFAATWEFGGAVSWIEVTLASEGGNTRLALEQTAIREDHWTQFGPGAVGIGWDLGLMGLGQHIASAATSDHAALEACMGSEDGKTFMRGSSELWRAADVAGGEDPAAARARSDRTIAFFRGEVPPDVTHPGAGS